MEIQGGYYPDFISKFCRVVKILTLIKIFKINGKASLPHRVLIHKRIKQGSRFIFIPTIMNRVAQLLVHRSLEPRFEANFEFNSYAYRPLRYAHDAIESIFFYFRKTTPSYKKFVLNVFFKPFFKMVNNNSLLAKLETTINITLQIKAWLETNYVENTYLIFKQHSYLNQIDLYDVNIIFPFLLNISLDGINFYLNS